MLDFETGRNMREVILRAGFHNASLLIQLRTITC